MSLRAEIQQEIGNAFDTDLADAVKTLILVKRVDTYNTDTGLTDAIETTYTTRGVLSEYMGRELFDTGIKPTDIKTIILANELSATPNIDEHIIDGSTKYKIIKVKQDPAQATWELQCRL